MLYNLDSWLAPGKVFPPKLEIPRLKGYRDNALLFDNESNAVLKPYIERLNEIVGRLKETDKVNNTFQLIPAYWQLSTLKTADLMVGDEPNVINEDNQEDIEDALQHSEFYSKLDELVIDNDSLGECIVRPYIDKEGKRNFVATNPSMWFPIVNEENIKEVLIDTLAWTVCTYQDANSPTKNKYELYVKIQGRGSNQIEVRRYAINKHYAEEYKTNDESFGSCQFYVIGALLETRIEEAQHDSLIIHIPGVTTSRSLHGISNYDRITEIVAEIAIRESLASFILDQNSAPRMGAPESAFIKNKEGRWVLKSGGRSFVVAPGEQPPVYITWDGSLVANENRINDLKKELYAMCEMGTVISHDDLNSSQGYEALEVKLTNPKLKVQRMTKKFKTPLKELVAFLVDKPELEAKDINIIFNEGIPTSESQNLDMAQKKKNLGVSTQSILMEYFGLTEEQAVIEVEKARKENADAFAENFGVGRNSLFGGGNDDNKDDDEDLDDEDENNAENGKKDEE